MLTNMGIRCLYVLINQTVWIAVFVIAINSSKVKLINPSKVVLLTFPLIVFIYLLNIRSGNLVLVNAAGTASSIYYVLLFMPFVLDIKKNILKIGLILLIVLCVLISLKRTAFIASILAITFYFIIEYKIKNKTMPKKMYLLFVMVFIAIASYWMYNYTTTVFDLDIIARLSNLHHDGGSNRNIIYQEVWLAIKDTPFIERFFGHGFNGVYLTGITTTSAHNDFLEVLYGLWNSWI
ncbi:MAG: O-antigen ligase family protein [Saccharofermentanales bacterium]